MPFFFNKKSTSYSEVEYCGFKKKLWLENGAHSNQNIPSIVKVKSKSKRRTKFLQLNRFLYGSLTGPHDRCSQSFLVALLHVTCNQELCYMSPAIKSYPPAWPLATLTSQSAAVGLTEHCSLPPHMAIILSTWAGTIGSLLLQPPIT